MRAHRWICAVAAGLGLSVAVPHVAAQNTTFESPAVTSGNLPVFYQKLEAQMLKFKLAYKPTASVLKWRVAARAKLYELTLEDEDNTPYDPVVLNTEDRGTYTAMRIVFNITVNSRIAALLLVPKGSGPFPAALVLHDHGGKFDIGKEKLIRPINNPTRLSSAQAWVTTNYGGNFIGDVLAQRGYVVLATDVMGWGDRTGNGSTAQQALASNVFNLGASLTGIMAQEDMRAADFLATYPGVDPNRVGSVGFSMGCFRTWMLAALSDTIRAGVCVNWMANDAGLMVPGNNQLTGSSAFQQMLPGMFKWFDYPDAASIAAPKPMFFFAGQTDPLFPIAAAQNAFAKMQTVWAAAGVPGNLQTLIAGNAHVFTAAEQATAFAWLDQVLPPGGGWIPPAN